jgi:hypothetical protein
VTQPITRIARCVTVLHCTPQPRRVRHRLERRNGSHIGQKRERMPAIHALHVLEEHEHIAVIAMEDLHELITEPSEMGTFLILHRTK